MTKTLRVALAGAGMISRHHLIGWKAAQVEVVAIADPAPEKAKARAQEFCIAQVFDDPEAMLEAVRPDVLDIASPVETHVTIAHAAAKRGIAVLCQKPLAPTGAEAQALATVARRVPFMAHENWRFRIPYRIARSWIRDGRIGSVRRFAISTQSSGLIAVDQKVAPAITRQPFFAAMPRLLIFEVLIHHLDVARALSGELTVAGAHTTRSTPAVRGEDRAAVLLSGNGCFGVVTGDYAVPGLPPTATDSVDVIGDRGRLTFDGTSLRLFDLSGEVSAEKFEPAVVYQSAFDNAISHFVQSLLAGAPFETSLDDNLRTFTLVEDAYLAAARSTQKTARSD
jgi:D-apiose dehydrogenase